MQPDNLTKVSTTQLGAMLVDRALQRTNVLTAYFPHDGPPA